MNWWIKLLNDNGEPFVLLGSPIVATRKTRDEAREFGAWLTENDATVSGFRVGRVSPE